MKRAASRLGANVARRIRLPRSQTGLSRDWLGRETNLQQVNVDPYLTVHLKLRQVGNY
jgi:hypothetical protein